MSRNHPAQLIDCARFGNPNSGASSWAGLAAVLLGVSVVAVSPRIVNAAPSAGAAAPLGETQSPLSDISVLLEFIIRLIGGNPEELSDPRLSLATKLNIVRGQYETYGIPQTLTAAEKQQLLSAILETHLLLMEPETLLEANVKAIYLFDLALQDMWDELGGTPGGLAP